MTDLQRTILEQRLLRDQRRALAILQRYGAEARAALSGEASGASRSPSHMADQASDMMERELSLFFASKERRTLDEIEGALQRLYEAPDQFGRCRRCDSAIPFARLESVPQATTCMECQIDVELVA